MEKPEIHGVIFDLDGTLLDTESISDQAINLSLLQHYHTLGHFSPSNPNNNVQNETKINHETIEENLELNNINESITSRLTQLSGSEIISEMNSHNIPHMTWEIKQQILGMRSDKWTKIVLTNLNISWMKWTELQQRWKENMMILCTNVLKMSGALELVQYFNNISIPMGIATSSGFQTVQIKRGNHSDIFDEMRVIVCGDDEDVQEGKPAPDIYEITASRMCINVEKCLVFEDSSSGVWSAKRAGMICIACPDSRLDRELFQHADHIIDGLDSFNPDLFNFISK